MKFHPPREAPFRDEIFDSDKLASYATFLAKILPIDPTRQRGKQLLPRLKNNSERLLEAYESIAAAVHLKQAISPAAEWLLDNYHVIEDQIREIEQDLPPIYYYELPKITEGDLKGYPRIYALAVGMIAHTDSHLDPDTIRKFVQSFQTVSELTIGELWAIPISLRLGLIENARRISDSLLWERYQYQQANLLADEWIENAWKTNGLEHGIQKIKKIMAARPEDQSALIAQLAKRLRDQDHRISPIFEFLEKHLRTLDIHLENAIQTDHHNQAANQVTMANIISSMRLLSSLDWRTFFESVSVVHHLLIQDPSQHYAQMDFETRDRYRAVIEDLAKRTGRPETEITRTALTLSAPAQHVGFCLLGPGLKELRDRISYRPPLKKRLFEILESHPQKIYFGLLAALLLMLEIFLFRNLETGLWTAFWICLLLVIPLSEVAIVLVNIAVSHVADPRKIPKLEFSKGIPTRSRTLVVIPCLIHDVRSFQRLLERLEIHYLGNKDPEIAFALLTDLADSDSPISEADEQLLASAIGGIESLNDKYPADPSHHPSFYLFHRRRMWNAQEQKWMGWERKRGKLHELNRLLRGATDTSFQDPRLDDFLRGVRYVITLDSDTHLPRDTAHRLIGSLSHPLNQAVNDPVSGKVTQGYSVLQPRVSMTMESASQSRFSRIFSGYTGIDPYTTAVSDLYQDLFQEGIYTGKGIYEVDSFERSLQMRIPENVVLSHDLLEGLHARAGLVTDIEIFDDYPASYTSYFKRQHRWVRGDWQIAHWLFNKVGDQAGNRVLNPLSFLDRWKIFDNLRRSLVALTTWLSYWVAWLAFPNSALWWCLGLTSIVAFPSLTHATNQILIHGRRIPWTSQFWQPLQDLPTYVSQFLLSLIFMAHQACLQFDAIVRSLYRRHFSRQNLLEWVPAARLEFDPTSQLWQTPYPTWILLGFSFVTIGFYTPSSVLFCFPFYLLWTSYPWVATSISRVLPRARKELEVADQKLLREIARRTWHFFETFVTAESNWLPPDNFQEDPKPVIAFRTSPTNIGVYLLSVISAADFGFIDKLSALKRLRETLQSVRKLQTHQGHLLNWYDIQTLSPLPPRYVSTVDSGNLAGHLIALQMACCEMRKTEILGAESLQGLKDVCAVILAEIDRCSGPRHFASLIQLRKQINAIEARLASERPVTWQDWHRLFQEMDQQFSDCLQQNMLSDISNESKDIFRAWTVCGASQAQGFKTMIETLAPWIRMLNEDPSLHSALSSLESQFHVVALSTAYAKLQSEKLIPERLGPIFQQARMDCEKWIEQVRSIETGCQELVNQMQFSFLLQKDRTVFSIGYNVEDCRHDTALYDLLASESRLASFVAIAKGDVPQEHWFRLGRQLVSVPAGRALISWTASMFEYLMPALVMKQFENTILDETLHTVVRSQIQYAGNRKVPWGISEAGYNMRDLQLNYQYGPFGIPGLGLKRGLSQDLVVSPYSTMLAAQIAPRLAVQNVRRLIREGLLKSYGFYEAIDYTHERLPEGKSRALIRSFMAHHQGMSLIALNNVLHENRMQNRFHSSTEIQSTQLLLQERIPQHVVTKTPKAAMIELDHQSQIPTAPYQRVYSSPNLSPSPVQLLSNGHYSLMVSAAGSGMQNAAMILFIVGEKTEPEIIGASLYTSGIWMKTNSGQPDINRP